MPVLTVAKYFPNDQYGFLQNTDGTDVFFHLGDFDGASWIEIPPIVGERVEASIESSDDSDKAPKAASVTRLDEPVAVTGVVETFQEERGWGFIQGDDGQDHYLHRSEVLDGALPLPGSRVRFIVGSKKNRPRACYVTIEDQHE